MSSRLQPAIAAIARATAPVSSRSRQSRIASARMHHHRVGELARVVVKDAVALEIHGCDGERHREEKLEFAERGATHRPAEPGHAWLAHARLAREVADRHASRGVVVGGDRSGDPTVGGRQIALDPLDARNDVDRRGAYAHSVDLAALLREGRSMVRTAVHPLNRPSHRRGQRSAQQCN